MPERLEPIYETVARVKAGLGGGRTLLGFAGSPWTVATYMVAGEGSRDQHETRALAYRDPGAFQAIIDAIVAMSRSNISSARSMPAPKRCSCSTAGRAASPRPNSSAG